MAHAGEVDAAPGEQRGAAPDQRAAAATRLWSSAAVPGEPEIGARRENCSRSRSSMKEVLPAAEAERTQCHWGRCPVLVDQGVEALFLLAISCRRRISPDLRRPFVERSTRAFLLFFGQRSRCSLRCRSGRSPTLARGVDRQPLAERHRAGAGQRPARPVTRIARWRHGGSGNAHHQAEVRDQPVIGAKHGGAQRVAAEAPVPALEAAPGRRR